MFVLTATAPWAPKTTPSAPVVLLIGSDRVIFPAAIIVNVAATPAVLLIAPPVSTVGTGAA